MIAYISTSFNKRHLFDNELNAIARTLSYSGIIPFIFVEQYRFQKSQECEMMQQAMSDIDHCDILIAETSDKAIGIGIEAGYAKAKNKPVIYIRQKDAEHSTTMSGISDFQVIYNDIADLEHQLVAVLNKILLPENSRTGNIIE